MRDVIKKIKVKKYEFFPNPDMFVSELLCDRCCNKDVCDPGDDNANACSAFLALEKEMP